MSGSLFGLQFTKQRSKMDAPGWRYVDLLDSLTLWTQSGLCRSKANQLQCGKADQSELMEEGGFVYRFSSAIAVRKLYRSCMSAFRQFASVKRGSTVEKSRGRYVEPDQVRVARTRIAMYAERRRDESSSQRNARF